MLQVTLALFLRVNAPPSSPSTRSRRRGIRRFWVHSPFAGGIALGNYAWRPPLWWFVAALACAAAAAWYLSRGPRFSLALTLTAFVFVGAFALRRKSSPGT